jgi:hypothetical protein
MGVDESAASGEAVDGAMVLFEIKMEHAGGEKYDESEDRALFHAWAIIPRPPVRVNRPAAEKEAKTGGKIPIFG